LDTLFLFFVGWIGGTFVGLALTIARVSCASVWAALVPHQQSSITVALRTVTTPSRTSALQETCLAITRAVVPDSPPLIIKSNRPSIHRESLSATLVSMSCPTCGLEAPEKLMREHFMGSPLHEHSTFRVSPSIVVSTEAQIVSPLIEDESDRTSLGDLLQTLNVMERLLKRDFYRHELRVGSRISARVTNIG
jgi:hypothetical protein